MVRKLFKNVWLFDGTGTLPYLGEALIQGNRIETVARGRDQLAADGAQVVDGGGATLMPGLTEAHCHLSFTNCVNVTEMGDLPLEEHTLLTMKHAKLMLDCGFTSCFSAASAKPRLDIVIRNADVLAVGVTIPLVIGLAWFITRTRRGRAMRATAQDPEAARLMGINVDATISLTFLIGGMLAGAAGLVYALYETTIWYFQGFEAGLIAFTAAVMGGIGNVRGAVLGGIIIGCIQQISDGRIGPEWTDAVVFAYLIAIMVLRPRGLLGEETREAG